MFIRIVQATILYALISANGTLHATNSSIAISGKLQNSIAGRIVQRRFEQYIGKQFSFTNIVRGNTQHTYTGKLEKIIIPTNPALDISAVFSGVKGETPDADDAIHALPHYVSLVNVPDFVAKRPLGQRGSRRTALITYVSYLLNPLVSSDSKIEKSQERLVVFTENARLLEVFRGTDKDHYEVVIENVIVNNVDSGDRHELELDEPLVLLLDDSHFPAVL